MATGYLDQGVSPRRRATFFYKFAFRRGAGVRVKFRSFSDLRFLPRPNANFGGAIFMPFRMNLCFVEARRGVAKQLFFLSFTVLADSSMQNTTF